eukprot:2012897-Alexandrium_andersonii.AAC.1
MVGLVAVCALLVGLAPIDTAAETCHFVALAWNDTVAMHSENFGGFWSGALRGPEPSAGGRLAALLVDPLECWGASGTFQNDDQGASWEDMATGAAA